MSFRTFSLFTKGLVVFFIIVIFSNNTIAATPYWANLQLSLRNNLKTIVDETLKWQNPDGSVFRNLALNKWDDEVEIFYSWLMYYLLTGDERAYEGIKKITLKYINRGEDSGYYFHGYWADGYNDTEHTLEGVITLANLAYVKPNDTEVVSALEHITEHLGNWVSESPDWFDYDTKHIYSLRPGTEIISSTYTTRVDWIFNLQFAKMALATYHATSNERYLNWVGEYLQGWMESTEKNKQENGYFLLPWEISADTGEIGPYSGTWYYPAFQPGWGWHTSGVNVVRDVRGSFLDYYKFTKKPEYLDFVKNYIFELFRLSRTVLPVNSFDGTSFTSGYSSRNFELFVHTSLLEGQTDPNLESKIDQLYQRITYSPPLNMWNFRTYDNYTLLYKLLNDAIANSNKKIAALQALTALPAAADDFPKMQGEDGIALSAFGGVESKRGEMPWTEVLYFKEDGSYGLEDGVAALVTQGNDSTKTFQICNTNGENVFVKAQANFLPAKINRVTVNGETYNDFDLRYVNLNVPARTTIDVKLEIFERDTIPANPVGQINLTGSTEHTLKFSWSTPAPAEDGDLPKLYKIVRDGEIISLQDSTLYYDTELLENTEYTYQVITIDKSNIQSEPTTVVFQTDMDVISPEITFIQTIDSTHLHVYFDEVVDEESATDLNNYLGSDGIEIQKAFLGLSQKVVYLTTSLHEEGIEYTLTVNGVSDVSLSGNTINNATYQYQYFTSLQIEQISRDGYFIRYNQVGDSLYSDRDYVITSIPGSLDGYAWLVTANNDKNVINDNFISFKVNRETNVYVAYDIRQVESNSVPLWLQSWERMNLKIETTDETDFVCYTKTITNGSVTLGGNEGNNSSSMYLVLIGGMVDTTPPYPPGGFSLTPYSN